MPMSFHNEAERLDIPLMPVKSAQVAAVGYDPITKTLAVTFTRGAGTVYQYPDITAATHAALLAAESIGKYFEQHIRPQPFKRFVTAPAGAR